MSFSQTVSEALSSVCVLQTCAVFTVDVSHCLERCLCKHEGAPEKKKKLKLATSAPAHVSVKQMLAQIVVVGEPTDRRWVGGGEQHCCGRS